MDQVLADTLIANLKSAKTAEEIQNAQTLALIAIVDCQRKTADRVKEMWSAREKVNWAARVAFAFASGGGFVVVAKVAHVIGVM